MLELRREELSALSEYSHEDSTWIDLDASFVGGFVVSGPEYNI